MNRRITFRRKEYDDEELTRLEAEAEESGLTLEEYLEDLEYRESREQDYRGAKGWN